MVAETNILKKYQVTECSSDFFSVSEKLQHTVEKFKSSFILQYCDSRFSVPDCHIQGKRYSKVQNTKTGKQNTKAKQQQQRISTYKIKQTYFATQKQSQAH